MRTDIRSTEGSLVTEATLPEALHSLPYHPHQTANRPCNFGRFDISSTKRNYTTEKGGKSIKKTAFSESQIN